MNSANLYINSILSHGAILLVTKPTRISNIKHLKILKLTDLYKLEVGKFIHANF